eukprot:6191844-Pleurochrysis_carterae.AAC.1
MKATMGTITTCEQECLRAQNQVIAAFDPITSVVPAQQTYRPDIAKIVASDTRSTSIHTPGL